MIQMGDFPDWQLTLGMKFVLVHADDYKTLQPEKPAASKRGGYYG
jgi:hypothetical protein